MYEEAECFISLSDNEQLQETQSLHSTFTFQAAPANFVHNVALSSGLTYVVFEILKVGTWGLLLAVRPVNYSILGWLSEKLLLFIRVLTVK